MYKYIYTCIFIYVYIYIPTYLYIYIYISSSQQLAQQAAATRQPAASSKQQAAGSMQSSRQPAASQQPGTRSQQPACYDPLSISLPERPFIRHIAHVSGLVCGRHALLSLLSASGSQQPEVSSRQPGNQQPVSSKQQDEQYYIYIYIYSTRSAICYTGVTHAALFCYWLSTHWHEL